MLKNINFRSIFSCVFLSVLAIAYINYQDQINKSLRVFLEWQHLNISIWMFIIVCFSSSYFAIRDDDSNNNGLIYKHFGAFADTAFAIVTYGLASTTSASILRGVYIQEFFKDKIYFNFFSQIDIFSMLVVCLFLFGYSLLASIRAVSQAILINSGENIEAA
jgi:hypothetical protein